MRRRNLLIGLAPLIGVRAAHADSTLRDTWLGTWRGSIVFRRALLLDDVYPPPRTPKVEAEDKTPIAFEMTLAVNGTPTVRTRIDGGPMQTSHEGEALAFAALADGAAPLGPAAARGGPASATLTVRPDAVGTEALFRHAAGGFWRRHINLRFISGKAEVIVWVFDVEGTRARTWRGDAFKQA